MQHSPAAAAGWFSAKLLLALTLLASLGGCERDTPTGPLGVRRVAIVVLNDTLRPGQVLQASAIALNGAGEVVEARVRWQSLTPSKLAVDSLGALRALGPGVGLVRASVNGVVAERVLQLVNPPVATIVPNLDSITLVLPGSPAQLSATPFDSLGDVIVGETLSWQSAATRIASVNASGVVSPVAVGITTVRVEANGSVRDIAVRVGPAPSTTAPSITSISPALIGPGTLFTLRGSRLQPTGSVTVVWVDGRPAQVLTATDSLVTAVLGAASLPCVPTADVAVQVTASGGIAAIGARLQLAPQRAPAVGEALILSGPNDLRCLELPGEGGYLVSVLNAARAIGAGAVSVKFEALSGLTDAPDVQMRASAQSANGVLTGTGAVAHSRDQVRAQARSRAHERVLDASLQATPLGRTAELRSEVQVAPLGELTPIRVPNLDAGNICTSYRQIHARTVYAGAQVYIVEDTSSLLGSTQLLTGSMDADIQRLGAEIDNVLWPIISRFGDPLVMDSRLDDNDHIVIVLTPELNAMQGGNVLGAVVTCDFYSRTQFAASNVGEMLYLQVPTLSGETDAASSIASWRRRVRGTVAHELKHVVSFAEHIVRNLPLEEVWLEEATAQHAEELFTRALTGVTAGGDAGYDAIRCEILAEQGDGSCAGTPALMKPSFDGLWDFLSASASRSPLGAMTAGDFSFYGSGWSLVRWAMDHSIAPEATFTQQLTVSTQSGVANLEARAGRSWDQILARWSLSLATDGRADFTAADPSLRLRSWNLTSVFAGLCLDLGPCGASTNGGARYTRAHPAQPLTPGANFTFGIAELAPAGFQLIEVAPGPSGTRRLLRLTGSNGAPPPAAARLAILRTH